MKLIVADYNSWEKTVEFDKAVVRIGSSPTSDIPLSSPNIAPIHLQFHYLPEETGCKVLNLGTEIRLLRKESEELLLSYARTSLENGDEVLLDGYRIRVELPIITKTIQTSRSISASLSFPNTTLYSYTPAVGWLTVKNIGVQSPCQFHVSVNGLPADCVKIDPIPLLYSGAQEEVRIQFFHRGLYPYAGLADLTLRVFAPSDYPGEQVLIEQGIYVTPVFEQVLEFVDETSSDDGADAPPANAPDLNMVAHSGTSSVPPVEPPPVPPQDVVSIPEPVDVPVVDEMDEAIPVTEEIREIQSVKKEKIAVQIEAESKPVVVRDLPEEFWDDDDE